MVVKITAIEIKRGRKYSENFQSAHYNVSVRIEATNAKDTLDDMRKVAMEGLMKLESEELIKVGDVIGVMGIEKEMMHEKRSAELKLENKNGDIVEVKKIRKASPGFNEEKLGFEGVTELIKKTIPKQPKNTKKINPNGKYTVAKKPCRTCGGLISWGGWSQGSLPVHVNKEGIIMGNGGCISE